MAAEEPQKPVPPAVEPEPPLGEAEPPPAQPEPALAEPEPPPVQPEEGVNQGAPGNRPLGESPLSVGSEKDAFAERPEVFVGAAFAGGLALALVLRRIAK